MDLTLIRDALNRVLRTVMQQLAVAIVQVLQWLVLQPDLTSIEVWQAAALMLEHLVLSGLAAYVHRTILDPSKIRSAAPPNTPSLSPPPYQPPAPGAI